MFWFLTAFIVHHIAWCIDIFFASACFNYDTCLVYYIAVHCRGYCFIASGIFCLGPFLCTRWWIFGFYVSHDLAHTVAYVVAARRRGRTPSAPGFSSLSDNCYAAVLPCLFYRVFVPRSVSPDLLYFAELGTCFLPCLPLQLGFYKWLRFLSVRHPRVSILFCAQLRVLDFLQRYFAVSVGFASSSTLRDVLCCFSSAPFLLWPFVFADTRRLSPSAFVSWP